MEFHLNDAISIAVIAGCLSLIGVFVAQLVSLVQAKRNNEYQTKVYRRSKYEEMAGHITESMVWADSIAGARTLAAVSKHASPAAAQRVVTLTQIYFPKLADHAENYIGELVDFVQARYNVLNSPTPTAADLAHQTKKYDDVAGARVRLSNAVRAHVQDYASV